MEKTRAFLIKNRQSFEDYGYFDDHKIYYEVIENKITSDNCIEACKSLIEGVSKTILSQININNPITRRRFMDQDLKSLDSTYGKLKGKTGEDFQPLVQTALVALSGHNPSFEKDVIWSVCKGFCTYLGNIRNDRGDISHGRESPKKIKSSHELAKFVVEITDSLVFSMLEFLVLIEFDKESDENSFSFFVEKSFSNKNELIEVSPDPFEVRLREFNDDLDAEFPLPGKARYSQALFQQYPEDYELQFQEYCDNLQKVEENASDS